MNTSEMPIFSQTCLVVFSLHTSQASRGPVFDIRIISESFVQKLMFTNIYYYCTRELWDLYVGIMV